MEEAAGRRKAQTHIHGEERVIGTFAGENSVDRSVCRFVLSSSMFFLSFAISLQFLPCHLFHCASLSSSSLQLLLACLLPVLSPPSTHSLPSCFMLPFSLFPVYPAGMTGTNSKALTGHAELENQSKRGHRTSGTTSSSTTMITSSEGFGFQSCCTPSDSAGHVVSCCRLLSLCMFHLLCQLTVHSVSLSPSMMEPLPFDFIHSSCSTLCLPAGLLLLSTYWFGPDFRSASSNSEPISHFPPSLSPSSRLPSSPSHIACPAIVFDRPVPDSTFVYICVCD